jgi:arylsulfatase
MIDHDRHVGQVLDTLDELGIADDTIFIYSTDNGPHMNSWPDGAMTPFRSEKNTNWEGAFRVPEMIRWPGRIPAGTVSNEIISHMDWLPTLVAAAGDPDVKDKLLTGHEANGKTFRVHLDGYNFVPYLTGEDAKGPRIEFAEQRVAGTLQVWAEPFVMLRVPLLFNLRTDPFERAQTTSNTYYDWMMDRVYLIVPSQRVVGGFLQTFMAYPPRMKAASFTVDQVMAKMEAALQGGH